MILLCVRHGQTDWNIQGKIQGISDIPLNETGLAQARQLSKTLKDKKYKTIYTSDLQRAKKTAEIISEVTCGIVHTDERLRERGYGAAEGIITRENSQLFRDLTLNIESHEMVLARALEFIEEISRKHTEEEILLVSHGGLIGRLLKHSNTFDVKIGNCSFSTFRYDAIEKKLIFISHQELEFPIS